MYCLHKKQFQLPYISMFMRSVCLKIGLHDIHKIQQMCEIYLSRYQITVQLCKTNCLEVEIWDE